MSKYNLPRIAVTTKPDIMSDNGVEYVHYRPITPENYYGDCYIVGVVTPPPAVHNLGTYKIVEFIKGDIVMFNKLPTLHRCMAVAEEIIKLTSLELIALFCEFEYSDA